MLGPGNMGTTTGYTVELQTKVHTKVRRNHGEGPYKGLLQDPG